MTFTGFPEEALGFYDGLLADNSKSYWEDHRATYERCVRAPMEALLAALEPEFGTGKIFRPYRDVRFSRDKTPYKNNTGAILHPPGDHGGSGFYVQIDAEGLRVAAGYYATGSDQVERYRRAVADDIPGAALERIVADLRGQGHEVAGHQLKTTPRGYPKDHPRSDLLRHRSLYAARSWEPAEWLHTDKCLDVVRDAWRDFMPLSDWLDTNVGASAQEWR